MHGVLIE